MLATRSAAQRPTEPICVRSGVLVNAGEYFLVAIADRDEAVKALRERRQLLDVQITVAGQATDEYLEWLDVRPGEIFCVMAVS